MKNLFISQPMRGKSDDEILQERQTAIAAAKEKLGEEVNPLETFFGLDDAKPLEFLGEAIKYLAQADVAYFVSGWKNARGCKIEHTCALEYGIPIIED